MRTCAILVVDDEPDLRDIVSILLEQDGHRVTCAADGAEASRLLAQQPFDVVLTDMLMPEKDGVEVIAEVRAKYPAVRIVAMSGGGHIPRDQYLKMAQKLGAHYAIPKPFTRDQLLAAIAPLATT